MSSMKRSEFITLLGGAAAWPLAARTQCPQLRVKGLGARHLVNLGFSRALSRADVRNRGPLMGRHRRQAHALPRRRSQRIASPWRALMVRRASHLGGLSPQAPGERAHNAIARERLLNAIGVAAASPSHATAIAPRFYAALVVY
jgi:hypothetical protein